MLSVNTIFLQKPKSRKIGEILFFVFCIVLFIFSIKEYKKSILMLDDILFSYVFIFGIMSIYLLFIIILPLKIDIESNSIYVKYLPKLYKRLAFEDILNITPISEEFEFNFLEKWWYGIYSDKNLYLIATRYRNYYINCKDNSIDIMKYLINEWNGNSSTEQGKSEAIRNTGESSLS